MAAPNSRTQVRVARQAEGEPVDPGRVLGDDLLPGRRDPGLPGLLGVGDRITRVGTLSRRGGHGGFLRVDCGPLACGT